MVLHSICSGVTNDGNVVTAFEFELRTLTECGGGKNTAKNEQELLHGRQSLAKRKVGILCPTKPEMPITEANNRVGKTIAARVEPWHGVEN